MIAVVCHLSYWYSIATVRVIGNLSISILRYPSVVVTEW